MSRFTGKTVLITGAARGQGREHAQAFAREGGDVVALDLCAPIASVAYDLASVEDLAATEQLVRDEGRECLALVVDVRDEAGMRAAVEAGRRRFGALDVVVANAGICPMTGESAQQMAAWHDVLDVVLTGTLITLRVTAPLLQANPGPSAVVVVGSIASLRGVAVTPAMLTPGQLGYGAAKHGVMSLMKNYAIALGGHDVRVNAILPGGVETPMVVNPSFDEFRPTAPAGWMTRVLGGDGLIQPTDVSNAVCWLASDEARFVTGHGLLVDGGAHLV